MERISKYLILGVLLVSLFGCQSTTPTFQQTLESHLAATTQAQTTALTHWDNLIILGSANCQTGLPQIPRFDLSQSQAETYPDSVAIRDHLNLAITWLDTSIQLWDQICAEALSTVTPELAKRGYEAIQQAKIELDLAQALFSAWKP